jgi:acyl carrier protein
LAGRFVDFSSPYFSRKEIAMATAVEIRARVTNVLVQALGVDEDEVSPSATLVGDLDAESIDFLDIVFRLEREFELKIPQGELFFEPILRGEPEYVQDGRVTEAGLIAIRKRMPYVDPSALERAMETGPITDLFTVELLVRYVTWKLEASGEVVTAPARVRISTAATP